VYLLIAHVLRDAAGGEILVRFLVDAGIEGAVARQICSTTSNLTFVTHRVLQALRQERLRCLVGRLQAHVGDDYGCRQGLKSITWSMVREMHRAGITIGSHTRNHVLLPNEPTGSLSDEMEGSRRQLESRLGVPIEHFAYPDGRFNSAAVDAVAESGYRYAYTTCSHRDRRHPLLTIPRSLLWENSSVDASGRFAPAILACQAQGLLVGKRVCTSHSHA
jgi:peptidoglycan/xylan/chitin deacetylase (PgdA/CDA1 family)